MGQIVNPNFIKQVNDLRVQQTLVLGGRPTCSTPICGLLFNILLVFSSTNFHNRIRME
jgi:hypothetical protein